MPETELIINQCREDGRKFVGKTEKNRKDRRKNDRKEQIERKEDRKEGT